MVIWNNIPGFTAKELKEAITERFGEPSFYQVPERLKLVERAREAGYMRRISHTQKEFTEKIYQL